MRFYSSPLSDPAARRMRERAIRRDPRSLPIVALLVWALLILWIFWAFAE